MGETTDLTYGSYLQLEKLLSLQQPRSEPPEHDETLFIIIHQVYELWFKQLLHEFGKIERDFSSGELFGAIGSLKRVRMIMKTLVGQLDILETMTPLSFASFRERLEAASGFQSAQFREVEFVLGYKRAEMLQYQPAGSAARRRLERRLRERTLVDYFHDFIETRGVAVPERVKTRDVTRPVEPNAEIQAGILRLYREQPDVAILMELMVDIDEGFQEWRYRHVKVAERTIGNKRGTGGSLGVEFLKSALFKPLFPDLWAVRHQL